MKRWHMAAVCCAVTLSIAFGVMRAGMAEEKKIRTITTPEIRHIIDVKNKVDEVLANQAQILKELADIRKAINTEQ